MTFGLVSYCMTLTSYKYGPVTPLIGITKQAVSHLFQAIYRGPIIPFRMIVPGYILSTAQGASISFWGWTLTPTQWTWAILLGDPVEECKVCLHCFWNCWVLEGKTYGKNQHFCCWKLLVRRESSLKTPIYRWLKCVIILQVAVWRRMRSSWIFQ